ncbi:uncharacterized protein F5891DRAFT_946968 [Suillus fuscotomentosus]|uniref:Uncharacterized protein n=1 Tax=Suillus fuscotomentosus TaxID=1912939 RepID=A0AAD4EC12_9AGAM|nr:uncharacterized protein F5891DRAFT_946968 [Suillus fuscotomentosus]KAG1903490.1 hypothetical protein F5891DRAFT_946968 [Suillus fuscotomentosus]
MDASAPPTYSLDDIKVEHHPNSGIKAQIYPFNNFHRRPATSSAYTTPNNHPWRPFQSRLEFEVAELALEVGLNNEQTDRLINICHQCSLRKDSFTLKNHKDIHSKWEAASHRITKFTKDVISVPYDGKMQEFDVYYRDLWDLATDLLRDPNLFPHFQFDAQHLSKFDGQTFVRFVDEPFTAEDFWNVQSQLPQDAKPLAFILYADKTRLSSFGTAKGYPVVARLANLPTDIRNGRGVGSGYIVGWLPIVTEDKEHSGKSSWVNFKNAVWHESFAKITSSLASKSRTGQWYPCLDGIDWWFFLCLLILSADYEEQQVLSFYIVFFLTIIYRCVMSLTRGVMSLWPCPICLIPRDELWDTSKQYTHRIADTSWDIVLAAQEMDTHEEQEELLKQHGLRNVTNSFWAIRYSDVHRALSHDRCHYNHGGLWSRHYWVELQKHLTSLGRAKVAQVDKNFAAFPRWRNLKHPNQVMSITFADSSVHEDISKMIIYAMHNILTEEASLLGYLLVRCVRLYLEVDMYAAFEVHTTNTISEGRSAVQALTAFMKQYIMATEEDDKNWNFPKLHMITHLFDDIEAKGVTRNYNTKPNEQMHGPLKDWYQHRTNFKNIAEQILRIDHWLLVADDIHRRIFDLDEYVISQRQANDIDEDADEDDPDSEVLTNPIRHVFGPLDGSMHVKFGSREALQTFSLIENSHKDDIAFSNFHVKLNSFLNVFLPASNIPLPDGKRIHLLSTHTITTCRLLRVNYESMVDWRQYTDYLRCNPKFFNAPRFDCVFIQTNQKVILGRLLLLFECPVGDNVFPLALVHPYDAPIGVRLRKDKHLNLLRVRAKPRAQAEFFSTRSIIRGALLVHDENLDYFVVDTVDTDMFLRVKEMHLQAGHVVRI